MATKTDTHYFFWKSKFGQWHISDMFDPETGLIFCCAEQYMMYKKAELFGDDVIMAKIMDTDNPREHKNLGRKVNGYSDKVWDKVAIKIVAYGNYLKFSQNPKLLKLMFKHKDLILVEASPIDNKWGIGLAEDDPDILDTSKWNGTNWLGEALMQARALIFHDYETSKLLIDNVN